MGARHLGLLGSDHARDGCLRRWRQPRPARAHTDPRTALQKDEVIIPRHSRNVYDAAVRVVGARIVEVTTRRRARGCARSANGDDLRARRAGRRSERAEHEGDRQFANPKGVPIFVDAAAEILTVPNVHLQNGATLVAYSGGKCLRGPQTAGLLLGRKDLVRAAWVHSAPHHGPGRAMKVGKEEAMGMLAAVEMWKKRDHDAEWKQWMAWLDAHREARVGDCRRDDDGHAARGIVEPDAFAAAVVGCGAFRVFGRNRIAHAARDQSRGSPSPPGGGPVHRSNRAWRSLLT